MYVCFFLKNLRLLFNLPGLREEENIQNNVKNVCFINGLKNDNWKKNKFYMIKNFSVTL